MRRRLTYSTLPVALVALFACAGTEAPASGGDAAPGADSAGVQEQDVGFESSGAVWDAARERGVAFRAVGQEPGWLVEVYPRQKLHILADYGSIEFDAPWAEPVREEGRLTYITSTNEHTVRIIVRDVPCSDTMSGEEFPQAVVLELDDRALYGCGRPLE